MKNKKTVLNGMFYSADTDTRLNVYQQAHIAGEFDVNTPCIQDNGREPLPPLSQQWKEDNQRRTNAKKRSSNR